MVNDEPIYASMGTRELWQHIRSLDMLIDLDPSSREVNTLIQLRELAKSYFAERTGYYIKSQI